jgi:hypothetical protein
LEALSLIHLGFEPIFDLILSDLLQVLMRIVEVPVGQVSADRNGEEAQLESIPIQLKQCYLHSLALSRIINLKEMKMIRTISSLHIGHASCVPDTVGAADMEVSALSRLMREARSCASGENCEAEAEAEADACEFRDRLLVEGDSRPLGCGDGVEVAGERFFPLPRTRPPPSTLRAMV